MPQTALLPTTLQGSTREGPRLVPEVFLPGETPDAFLPPIPTPTPREPEDDEDEP